MQKAVGRVNTSERPWAASNKALEIAANHPLEWKFHHFVTIYTDGEGPVLMVLLVGYAIVWSKSFSMPHSSFLKGLRLLYAVETWALNSVVKSETGVEIIVVGCIQDSTILLGLLGDYIWWKVICLCD